MWWFIGAPRLCRFLYQAFTRVYKFVSYDTLDLAFCEGLTLQASQKKFFIHFFILCLLLIWVTLDKIILTCVCVCSMVKAVLHVLAITVFIDMLLLL